MTKAVSKLGAMTGMASQGQKAVEAKQVEVLPAPDRPVIPPADAPTPRRPFGTRLDPRLHNFLKRFSVDLGEQIGTRQAIVENVVNALVSELESDPELQARIRERCRR